MIDQKLSKITSTLSHLLTMSVSFTDVATEQNVITASDRDGNTFVITVDNLFRPTASPDLYRDGEITNSAGDLPCGCHGSQREHTCNDDIFNPSDEDDDSDDDDEPADGESFDGGFGQGSYFQNAMRKDD